MNFLILKDIETFSKMKKVFIFYIILMILYPIYSIYSYIPDELNNLNSNIFLFKNLGVWNLNIEMFSMFYIFFNNAYFIAIAVHMFFTDINETNENIFLRIKQSKWIKYKMFNIVSLDILLHILILIILTTTYLLLGIEVNILKYLYVILLSIISKIILQFITINLVIIIKKVAILIVLIIITLTTVPKFQFINFISYFYNSEYSFIIILITLVTTIITTYKFSTYKFQRIFEMEGI